jgi:hypothetical protein
MIRDLLAAIFPGAKTAAEARREAAEVARIADALDRPG